MSRTLHKLALLLAPSALVLGGLAASPALAASSATISGTVVDFTTGDPIRGIEVYTTKDGQSFKYIGSTNSQGAYSSARGATHPTGDYYLDFEDPGNDYAPATSPDHNLHSGANQFDPVQMKVGSTVEGLVKAPSGKLLKNVGVVVARNNTDPFDFDYGFDKTLSDGKYVAGPVGVGNYHVFVSTDNFHASRRVVSVTVPDSTVTADAVTGIKVPVSASFSGSSPSKHKATIKVTVSAATYGLTGPGGKVTVYDGSKAIRKNVTLSSTGKVTIHLSGLKKKTHTFRVRFLGGTDTLAKYSSTHKVKVK